MKPEIKVKKVIVEKIRPAGNDPNRLSGQICFSKKGFSLFFQFLVKFDLNLPG
jgi:hypothetical protein